MRKYFIYNFTEKTIIGSKTAINRANKGMNPEYRELTEMLAEYPTFKVQEKIINHKKDKQTYNNLTFDRMKEFISTKDNSKQRLLEFEAVKAVAAAKGAKYPLTKKWFLAKYDDYKIHEITEDETKPLLTQKEEANNVFENIDFLKTETENKKAA